MHSKGIFPGTLREYNGSTIGVQWGYRKLQNCADLRKALHMRCQRPPRLNCCCYTWCSASTDPIVFAIRLPQPSPNMPRQLQPLPLPMLFEVDQTHETMIKSHRIRSETDTSSHFVSHFEVGVRRSAGHVLFSSSNLLGMLAFSPVKPYLAFLSA